MRQNTGPRETAEKHVRDIRRATRRKWPDRYFVPGGMRDYWATRAVSSGCCFDQIATGAGGL